MAVNDFSNQNIQDTYQRVVQTDGTNLADGTGSALPIKFEGPNLIVSGAVRANSYIVSESILVVTSGSTVMGNSFDDTHTFSGSININDRVDTGYNTITPSLFVRQDAVDRSQIANGFGGSIDFHTQRGSNSSGARTGRIASRLTAGAQSINDFYALDFNLRSNDTQIDLMTLHTSNTNTTGRVGILDTTPAYTLDVNGSFRATGDINAHGDIKGDGSTKIGSILQITSSIVSSSNHIQTPILKGNSSQPTQLSINGILKANSITSSLHISASGNISGSNIFADGNISASGNIIGTWQGTAIAHDYIGLDAIDGTNIADDAINSEHYTDASIDTAHIADDQVTYAKIQNVTNARILGNNAGSDGNVTEMTKANVLSFLNVEDGATADQTGAEIATALNSDLGGNFTIGNQSNDTATFSGGIVSQGNISASGNITGSNIFADGNISASGNVITSKTGLPGYQYINYNTDGIEINVDDGNAIKIDKDTGTVAIGTSTIPSNIKLHVNGATSINGTLSASGNFTGANLDINGNADISGDLIVDGGNVTINGGNVADSILKLATNTAGASDDVIIELVTDEDGTPRQARIGVDHSDNTLKLVHGSGFSGGTNGICVDSGGKVGIGTATPGEKLEVVGNISASGNVNASHITASGNISASLNSKIFASSASFGGASFLRGFNVKGAGLDGRLSLQGAAGTDNPGIEFTVNDNTSRALIRLDQVGTNGTALEFFTEPDGGDIANTLTIGHTGHITASGNISASGNIIGNNLEVNGNITASGIIDGNTNSLILGDKDGNVGGSRIEINQSTGKTRFRTTNVEIGESDGANQRLTVYGHITASGNISASGNVNASHITASGNVQANHYYGYQLSVHPSNFTVALNGSYYYLPLTGQSTAEHATSNSNERIPLVNSFNGHAIKTSIRSTNNAALNGTQVTCSIFFEPPYNNGDFGNNAPGSVNPGNTNDGHILWAEAHATGTSQNHNAIHIDWRNPFSGSFVANGNDIPSGSRVYLAMKSDHASSVAYVVSTTFAWDYSSL